MVSWIVMGLEEVENDNIPFATEESDCKGIVHDLVHDDVASAELRQHGTTGCGRCDLLITRLENTRGKVPKALHTDFS